MAIRLAKQTNCSYRGCMKPLPATRPAFQVEHEHKMYCDAVCRERDLKLRGFRDKERA